MMIFVVPLICAVVPVIVLVLYFYTRDERPEPSGLVLTVFFFGLLSVLPVILVELFLRQSIRFREPLLDDLFSAFVVAGAVEELSKLTVVMAVVYNRKEFDERADGIVYAVVAGLGFACVENIMYVMNHGMSTALMRAFTAVPMHALVSGIMGYFIGLSKTMRGSPVKGIAAGLLIAIALHGLYDFLLFHYAGRPIGEGGLAALLIFPLVIILWFVLGVLIRRHTAADRAAGRA